MFDHARPSIATAKSVRDGRIPPKGSAPPHERAPRIVLAGAEDVEPTLSLEALFLWVLATGVTSPPHVKNVTQERKLGNALRVPRLLEVMKGFARFE